MHPHYPQKRRLPKDTDPVASDDLLSSPLFASLEQEPELLQTLCADSQFIVCDHGYPLIEEHSEQSVLIVVCGGSVNVCRTINGKEHTINYFGPGNVLGELNILTDLPHAASVFAEDEMAGIDIAPNTFRRCLSRSRFLYRNLARGLALRICDNDARLATREEGRFQGKRAVALAIEDLIRVYGFLDDGETLSRVITHKQLAFRAGCSRGTTTAAINDLILCECIENEDRVIKVLDRVKLNLYASGQILTSDC